MPKDASRKGPAPPNNPYPSKSLASIDVNAISKAVLESVTAALRGIQDTANEDSSGDDDEGIPTISSNANNSNSTLSSNSGSLEENFQISIATHHSNVAAAEGKLKDLEVYLTKFKANRNIDGIDATYKLISKWVAKKAHAEFAIDSETKHFKAQELARAEEAARTESIRKQKEKEAKGKGKSRSQIKDEEDEDFARLEAFMNAHSDKEDDGNSEFDDEFAELDDLLLSEVLDLADAPTPSIQPIAPAPSPAKAEKTSLLGRPMPAGFTITLRRPPTKHTSTDPDHPNPVASSSKHPAQSPPTFDDSAPLLGPTEFSPRKLLDGDAPQTADGTEHKPKSKHGTSKKMKKQTEPTRVSSRKNAGANGSYADSADEGD